MSKYIITTHIETEEDYTKEQILEQIDTDLNRGDGIYMDVDDLCTINECPEKRSKWTPDTKWVIFFWALCVSSTWTHSFIVLMVGFGTLYFERSKVKYHEG